MSELLPCPWCGATVDHEDEWGSVIIHTKECYWENINGDPIGAVRVNNSTKAAWNRRADAPKQVESPAPIEYKCSKCGATGYKLWRQYQTFLDRIELRWGPCALLEQGRVGSISATGKVTTEYGDTDQIGNLIPAVPTPDGCSFWGYTSVPDDGVVECTCQCHGKLVHGWAWAFAALQCGHAITRDGVMRISEQHPGGGYYLVTDGANLPYYWQPISEDFIATNWQLADEPKEPSR